MIDIFVCAKSLYCRIRNCHVIAEGVESDHATVRLDLIFTSLKRANSNALNRGSTDWRKIATDPPTTQRYNDVLADLLNDATADSPDMPIEVLDDVIKKAGEDTALLVRSQCDNWFNFNANKLTPSIKERDQVLHALRSSADLPPSIADSLCVQLRCLNKHVKDKVLIAKARWAAHLCSKIHNMRSNTRVAWEYIRLLTKGNTAHHKKKYRWPWKWKMGSSGPMARKT
jgi:hypothetical protein